MQSQIRSFKHQDDALQQTGTLEYAALLLEMGLGKSRIALQTAQNLYNSNKITGLLIIAPKSICRTWAEEQIPAHLECPKNIVLWSNDSKKFSQELQKLYKNFKPVLYILIVNVETIASDRCYDELDKFLRFHKSMMIIDESTTIKNFKAVRTKTACRLGRLAKYRRILTGTPITQSPLDLYSQFDFLKSGCLGSNNYYGFRNQYAIMKKRYINGKSFHEVIGYQRLEELQTKMQSISFRALKRDCLDLPEKIYQIRYVHLTPLQINYYWQMKQEALAFLKNGAAVAAPLVITQMLRLQQALCNLVPATNENLSGQTYIDDKNPRLEEILNIIDEAGDQKIIIWANFIQSIKDIAAAIKHKFNKQVGVIYGDVSAEDRQAYVESFQNSDLQFIVAQPRTGGYGLTLTAATLVIYYDHNWSLEVRQQSEDRAHRIGQTKNVTYIDLVATGTIDEKIRNSLVNKKDLANIVTGDGLKKLLEE